MPSVRVRDSVTLHFRGPAAGAHTRLVPHARTECRMFDPLFALLFVHLLVCSLQEEEDLQSEVTLRRWLSLSAVPPYSPQQRGFGGAEMREGCCGWGWGWGLLFPLIRVLNVLTSPFLSFSMCSLIVTLLHLSCFSSLSANMLFLISSQFCSCLLTTFNYPCSFHFQWEVFFCSACLWCSFAPHTACWPAICYSL